LKRGTSGWYKLRQRLHALRGQAVVRIFSVMLIAVLGTLAIGVNGYNAFCERETRQKHQSLKSHFGEQLKRTDYAWSSAAGQVRAQLEFARLLEQQDARRWPKLTAFLNAQRIFVEFPTLLVLDRSGEILFRYGAIAHTLEVEAMRGAEWHFSSPLGELYRVFHEPVWLGAQGQGQLILLKPLDNAALQRMVIPEYMLAARWQGSQVAASRSDYPPRLADNERLVVATGEQRWVQARIAWPGRAAGRPVLLAYRELHDILPFANFLYWLLGAIGFIALLLWLVLARWLSGTVRRLEAVDHALDAYADQAPRESVERHLVAARWRQDEINNLADGIMALTRAVDARQREQTTYLETLALLEEAVLELTCEGRILRASPGWNKLADCDDAVGRNLLEFIHPDDLGVLSAQCSLLLGGEKDYLLFRLRLKSGHPAHESWIECRFLGFRDEHGVVQGVRGVMRDITQAYLHEKQVSHIALHDALTGLPNRVLLEDRLKVALRLAERSGHHVCVCFIDIDHFKTVNDTLGHKAGDRLLVAFAERLRSALRSGDTLARWGGDEFVLLLPGMQSEQDIHEVTDKIGAVIQQPLLLDGVEMRVTFSLGAAIYPDDGDDGELLFSQADRAMFHAKAQGRNQVCYFGDMSSKGAGKRELYIRNRLAGAIDTGSIQAWFQPILCARTGVCMGAEVLARWHDAELGWIPPATFIPIAENVGLIRELGRQVWLASVAMQTQCRADGWRLRFAVNVSKRQLFMPSFAGQALADLASHGISPGEVAWEVTESVALRDVEHATERLQELKKAGFTIAIDDFGTGYSSLSQLHEIHADELKIDISFVRRIQEPAGLSLVQAIIKIANALQLKTVAEGVEDAATAEILRGLGVDYLQGYHFARPMPGEAFVAWLGAPGVATQATP